MRSRFDIRSLVGIKRLTSFILQARNADFLGSRKDDRSVNEREHAIQSLELAYHKCKEIEQNLEEGRKVCGLGLQL
jgi:ALIX V-shaped domain binding to HIV